MIVLPPVDYRIERLCGLFGHDTDTYPSTDLDPGGFVCRDEVCCSRVVVGLWKADQLARQAVEAVWCPCQSPQLCSCSLEPVRFQMRRALRGVINERRILAGNYGALAEQVLAGKDRPEPLPQPRYCDVHTLVPEPCIWCSDVVGVPV